MNRYITAVAAAAGLLFAAGCGNNKFGPMAIPSAYEVMPAVPREEKNTIARLQELQKIDTQPYRITSMDRFYLSVYEEPDLEVKEVVVTPDGYIAMPLLGPVRVGGLTLPEATELLTRGLKKWIRTPRVAMIPLAVEGYNFTIAGRVNRPGCYPITIGRTRLIDAVALSGGFSEGLFNGSSIEMADLNNAYISRAGELLPVNFTKAITQGDQLNNIPLQNGDYIYVPSVMTRSVAVLGAVVNSTYVGYREGMTLLQALPYTRGLLDTHSSYIKIIRGGMKDPVVYTVNLDDILEGKVMDFELQASDVVYVPLGPLSEWNVIMRKVVPTFQVLNLMAGPFGNPSGYINLSNN